MDKLLKIEQLLVKEGHELARHWSPGINLMRSEYFIKNNNIEYILIDISYPIIYLKISKIPSSREVYRNRGYHLNYPSSFNYPICENKIFRSFEDLLDELQGLRLINCGHSIKSAY